MCFNLSAQEHLKQTANIFFKYFFLIHFEVKLFPHK